MDDKNAKKLIKTLEDINKTLAKIEKNTRPISNDNPANSPNDTVDNGVRNSVSNSPKFNDEVINTINEKLKQELYSGAFDIRNT